MIWKVFESNWKVTPNTGIFILIELHISFISHPIQMNFSDITIKIHYQKSNGQYLTPNGQYFDSNGQYSASNGQYLIPNGQYSHITGIPSNKPYKKTGR